jgi:O-antigen/teichoic acid export membrane protein
MLARNFSWKLSGYLLGGGVYFLFTLLLIRHLGPVEYGKFAFALGWAGLFAILVDYGFNPIITRDLSRSPTNGTGYWHHVQSSKLLLWLAAAVLLTIFSLIQPQARKLLTLSWLALIFLGLNSFMETAQAFTYAYEKFRDGALLTIAHKWLITILGGSAIYIGWKTHGILAAMAVGATFGALVMVWYFKHKLLPPLRGKVGIGGAIQQTLLPPPQSSPSRGEEVKLKVSLWEEAFPVLLQNIFIVIYFKIDTVMLSFMAGDLQTGWYNAAYRFLELSNILPTAIMAVLVAPLSRQIHMNQWLPFFRKYLAGFLLAAFLGFLILLVIASVLPRFILGYSFTPSQPILRVLALTLFFYYPNYLLTMTLIFLKRQAANAWVALACVFFNIGMNLYAIPRWGAMGAAWMTMATEALISVVSLFLIFKWRNSAVPKTS